MLGFKFEGLGWFTYEIVRYWVDNVTDVKWSLLFDRQSDYFSDTNADIIILTPKTSHTPSITVWNEFSLSRWLSKNDVDAYFSPDGFIPLRSVVPCFPVVHDIAPLVYPNYMRWRDYIFYRIFQIKMIKRATHVFTVSEFSKNEIIRYVGCPQEHVTVAYNGLHSGFKNQISKKSSSTDYAISGNYFFYLGAVHPRKNVFGLIQAYNLYRDGHGSAQLVIAGRKAWKSARLDALLDDSAYKNDIIWLSYLDGADLQRIMKNAVALVYVSHYEGFGLPVLEAMALGVPVITSSDSAMSEIGAEAVLTAESLAHHDIAEHMHRIESDLSLRNALIQLGYEQSTKFNYSMSAQNILKKMKIEIERIK